MPRRAVSTEQLAYYRSHILEAVREDGVVCLECGRLFRSVPFHVKKHQTTSEDYRATWGYNRGSALSVASTRELKRQVALACGLPVRGAPTRFRANDARAREGRGLPVRLEERLRRGIVLRARIAAGWQAPGTLTGDALQALVAAGMAPSEVAAHTGRSPRHVRTRLRALGLIRPAPPIVSDSEVLALRQSGLWPSEVAARTGLTVSAVRARFERLRRGGVLVPPPAGPRPHPLRRVRDETLVALDRAGLGLAEMAARAGIAVGTLVVRRRSLRRRGLLSESRRRPPPRPPRRPAVSIEELARCRERVRRAIRSEGVVCLECGGVFQSLGRHVLLHGLAVEEYRVKWGYAKRKVFLAPRLRQGRRRGGTASARDRRRATKARRADAGRRAPRRVSDETLRELARQGLGAREILTRTSLRDYYHLRRRLRRLGLAATLVAPFRPRPKDLDLLALREAGFPTSEIAARTGLTARSVRQRLQWLGQHGMTVPQPPPPRPHPNLRVPDAELLALIDSGLSPREVAARMGIARGTVYRRLRGLRGRGRIEEN